MTLGLTKSKKADLAICWRVQDQLNGVARFLDGRGMTEEALEIATDPDYRFELAVQLSRLETALDIAEASDSEAKWRQLGELALSSGKLEVRPQPCRPSGLQIHDTPAWPF